MKLPTSLAEIQQLARDGQTFDYVFFWGHRQPKDGSVDKSCFSQWYPASFVNNGVHYKTAEHWMMAEKARLFEDDTLREAILAAADPKTAKALGRKVHGFDEAKWETHCRQIVTEGNLFKFAQNEPLKKFLLDTAGNVLVEASPYDRIWGIGLRRSDRRANDPLFWQGQNLLGFALMDVREQLA